MSLEASLELIIDFIKLKLELLIAFINSSLVKYLVLKNLLRKVFSSKIIFHHYHPSITILKW